MKIACIGKGGSGKTTVCALLARAAAASHKAVVAYDADVNQHLGLALGIEQYLLQKMPLLGYEQPRIKKYLRGTNPRITSEEYFFKTTPPGSGSNLLRASGDNPVYEHFSLLYQGVRLLRVGDMEESDLGVKCFHGKNGVVEALLSHTLDHPEDRILVDMTAGTDALASGLFARVHGLVLVVEPTMQSTAVYKQITELTTTPILLVANKVEDDEDIAFIMDQTGRQPAVILPRSKAIRRLERGETVEWPEFESSLREALGRLDDLIATLPCEWQEYEQRGHEIHRANAQSWINQRHNITAEAQIDPDFSLATIANQQ